MVSTRLAAAHAQLRTVGVTGTNGKTTTTSMVAAIAAGEPAARVTTVGAWVENELMSGGDLVHEKRPEMGAIADAAVVLLTTDIQATRILARSRQRTWPGSRPPARGGSASSIGLARSRSRWPDPPTWW